MLFLRARTLVPRSIITRNMCGYISEEKIPESFDWRNQGVLTDIKTEKEKGTGWAYASVSAVESLVKIQTGNLMNLSTQEVIDLSVNASVVGAFDYIIKIGIRKFEDYPHVKQMMNEKVFINGFEKVTCNDEMSFLRALNKQPVVVLMAANREEFQGYKGGVYKGPYNDVAKYAMVAVGYSPEYIILRNSWGSRWGEEGYLKVSREVTDKEGPGKIFRYPVYPTGNIYYPQMPIFHTALFS